MPKELITIESTPKVPTHWSYEESIKKVKTMVYKWKNITIELAQELWIAREFLSSQGARTDKKEQPTWENYCQEISIDKSTANRWLNRYFEANAPKLESPKLPEGKFNIIYADPPWKFENSGFEQSAASKYPTMSTEEICKLAIPEMSAKDSVLFMWATNAMLEDAFDVMRSWGFVYKSNLVWIKNRGPSIGWFTKSKHELLLIGVNENGMHPKEKFDSWFKADVTKHSKKPELVYDIIEKMYPKQNYIELFARNKRSNWISWGNQV